MPNIKSQKDRVRLAAKQTARNRSNRSALRTTIKKAKASIEANADNKMDVVNIKFYALSVDRSVRSCLEEMSTTTWISDWFSLPPHKTFCPFSHILGD